MFGTIVNIISIVIGSILGLIIKDKFSEKYQNILTQGIGMSVIFIGISGAVSKMILPQANPVLFIISLVIGGLIGEFFDIDAKLDKLGDILQNKFGQGESKISKGFVSGSLLFCVGTMSVLGSLESSLQGVHKILYAKSILDGVSSVVFASTLGIGVLFSAVSVFIYQGSITALASFIQPFITEDMLREISIVGGILITGLGLDILGIKKIKVANLLPSIVIPVIYYLLLIFIK